MKILLFILLPGLVLLNLVLKIKGSVSPIPVLSGPDVAYLGSTVVFGCKAPGSSPPVTYQLIRDTNVITTATNLQAGQPATFLFRITGTSEGSYSCRATAGGHTGDSNNIRLHLVRARLTSDPDPPVLYEGSRLVLSCDVAGVSRLSYTWFFDRKKVAYATLPSLHLAGNKLAVENVSAPHAGIYSCMAEKDNRSSSSTEVQVVVKVFFSKPSISLTISKVGTSYSGNVTCRTSRGSPPVTFYFLLDGEELGSVTLADSTEASFPVAVVPGQDMGTVHCLVKNEAQQVMSKPLILEVVPVGGDVKVEVEHLYGADSKTAAVKLHCLLSRGTFPSFSWVFNNSDTHTKSPIESMSHRFALADDQRTLILTTMDPGVSGYYQCRARNSYDDSSPWFESPAVLVQMTGVTMSIIEIISISFCCFMLVMLVGGVAFVVMLLHQKAHAGLSGTTHSDARALSTGTSLGQMDASSIDSDVHNQTLEITV